MDLKQFANVDSFYRDLETGMEISWHEYMSRVIEKLGIENIQRYIPFDFNYLKARLKEDVHLNNTNMRLWDIAAGFDKVIDNKTKVLEYKRVRFGVADLLVHNGITFFSPSECVCVLKEAARRLCIE